MFLLDCVASDLEATDDKKHQEQENATCSEEADLLNDHREYEVVVRFRQIMDLLDAVTEADSSEFASADRDQRLRQLIARA